MYPLTRLDLLFLLTVCTVAEHGDSTAAKMAERRLMRRSVYPETGRTEDGSFPYRSRTMTLNPDGSYISGSLEEQTAASLSTIFAKSGTGQFQHSDARGSSASTDLPSEIAEAAAVLPHAKSLLPPLTPLELAVASMDSSQPSGEEQDSTAMMKELKDVQAAVAEKEAAIYRHVQTELNVLKTIELERKAAEAKEKDLQSILPKFTKPALDVSTLSAVVDRLTVDPPMNLTGDPSGHARNSSAAKRRSNTTDISAKNATLQTTMLPASLDAAVTTQTTTSAPATVEPSADVQSSVNRTFHRIDEKLQGVEEALHRIEVHHARNITEVNSTKLWESPLLGNQSQKINQQLETMEATLQKIATQTTTSAPMNTTLPVQKPAWANQSFHRLEQRLERIEATLQKTATSVATLLLNSSKVDKRNGILSTQMTIPENSETESDREERKEKRFQEILATANTAAPNTSIAKTTGAPANETELDETELDGSVPTKLDNETAAAKQEADEALAAKKNADAEAAAAAAKKVADEAAAEAELAKRIADEEAAKKAADAQKVADAAKAAKEKADEEARAAKKAADDAAAAKKAADEIALPYRGTMAVTRSGRTCQRWDAQRPHRHRRVPKENPDDLRENYCRQPKGVPFLYCYTLDRWKRWEPCDISKGTTTLAIETPSPETTTTSTTTTTTAAPTTTPATTTTPTPQTTTAPPTTTVGKAATPNTTTSSTTSTPSMTTSSVNTTTGTPLGAAMTTATTTPLVCQVSSIGSVSNAGTAGPCVIASGVGVSSVSNGGICSPACAVGYTPSFPLLFCRNGAFSPPTFVCVPKPCIVGNLGAKIANVGAGVCVDEAGIVSPRVASGSTCHAVCSSGFTPSSPGLVCDRGIFSPETFACNTASVPPTTPAPSGW